VHQGRGQAVRDGDASNPFVCNIDNIGVEFSTTAEYVTVVRAFEQRKFEEEPAMPGGLAQAEEGS
jgi:hypothetical protein